MLFDQQHKTSLGLLLIDIVFTTLVKRDDMVEQHRDVKTAAIQRQRIFSERKGALKSDSHLLKKSFLFASMKAL